MAECNAKPYEGNEKYIFFSYSHEDAAFAYPMIERMVQHGFRVWYDSGLHPGDDWPEVIAEHLQACEACVILMTKHAMQSHNCRNELTYAIESRKLIVPLLFKDVVLSPGIKYQLSSTQRYVCESIPGEETLKAIFQADALSSCKGTPVSDIALHPFAEAEKIVSKSEWGRGLLKLITRSKVKHTYGPEPDPEPVPKREPEPIPEPDPEPVSKREPEPIPEPDPEPVSKREPEPIPEPDPEPVPKREPEQIPEPKPEPDPEPAPEREPESIPEPKPEPDPEPAPEREPEPMSEPKPEPDPEPVSKREPEPIPEPEPEPDPEPAPKREPEPMPEPKLESEPKPAPKREPEPIPEPKPEPYLWMESYGDPLEETIVDDPVVDEFDEPTIAAEVVYLPVIVNLSSGECMRGKDGETKIGRGSNADIQVYKNDRTIGREHVCLYSAFGKNIIKDMNSRNGTKVDGVKLEASGSVEVGNYAQLTIAQHSFFVGFRSLANELWEAKALASLCSEKTGEMIFIFQGCVELGRSYRWKSGAMSASNIGHKHATIRMDGDECSIEDHSRNGTYVNEKRIPENTPYQLTAGDRIRIGSEYFVYNCVVLEKR